MRPSRSPSLEHDAPDRAAPATGGARRLRPGIEEQELQIARLAADLGLDRGAPCDERHLADYAHLAVGAVDALVLGLARLHRLQPARLGVGHARGMRIEQI